MDMTFGQRIKEGRKKKNWSVYQLAEAIRDENNKTKSAGYVSKIEARGEIPSPHMIMELGDALGINAEELFELAKKEKSEQLTKNINKKYDYEDTLTLYRKSKEK